MCGTDLEKPAESQACGGGCAENWNCTAWSACANGIQARACTDMNGCGTMTSKPLEQQSCGKQTLTAPAMAGKNIETETVINLTKGFNESIAFIKQKPFIFFIIVAGIIALIALVNLAPSALKLARRIRVIKIPEAD